MKDRLLDIDIQVMLLRYGRQNVLSALARLTDKTLDQLEHELHALDQKPTQTREKRPQASLVEIVSSEYGDRSDIIELLRSLAVAFENRSFLPNLRDVERFLDRGGASSQRHKSRATAGPVVFRMLSKLPKEELASLLTRNVSDRESDYSLLSRAIMGGPSVSKGG